MEPPERRSANSDRVIRTAEYLRDNFPEMSLGKAKFHALPLVEAPDWNNRLHHRGANDQKALKSLSAALCKAKVALDKVSPWIEEGLETALHRSYISPDCSQEIPFNKTQFLLVLDEWIAASNEAELMRQEWRADHGKNWRAIALIDDARKFWKVATGKTPPPKKLRDDTKFAEFLNGLFVRVGVHANIENAYKGWSEIAHMDGSPFDKPERGKI